MLGFDLACPGDSSDLTVQVWYVLVYIFLAVAYCPSIALQQRCVWLPCIASWARSTSKYLLSQRCPP